MQVETLFATLPMVTCHVPFRYANVCFCVMADHANLNTSKLLDLLHDIPCQFSVKDMRTAVKQHKSLCLNV